MKYPQIVRSALSIFTPLALLAGSSANAAESSAGSGEIAIYTEATGTDAITTADFTHDFDTTDREDPGSFTRSGTDVTLNRAGHYLAIYNSQFTGTGTNRAEIQSYLNLNGTDLASGWSQGYIRRDSLQFDTVTAGAAIISATANDILQLRSFRTDNNGGAAVTRTPAATGLQLVKLDEVNMSYARLSLATDTTGPADATWLKVPYDTDDELDASFTHGAAGDLTLVNGGKYLVMANTYVAGVANRTATLQRLALDGTEVSGSKTSVYLRGTSQNSCGDGTAACAMIIEATAGQVLSVETSLDVNGSLNMIGGKCALTVVELPSLAQGTATADPDFIRIRHLVNQDINTATETALIFDTNDEVDAGSFAHSASASAITVQQPGDYLFLGSFFSPDDGTQRGFPSAGWSINGGARLTAGQTGRYSRNTGGVDQFGNFGGLIASTLAANDTVEWKTLAIGAAGTNNANPTAIQGVRIASLFDFKVLVSPTTIAIAEGGATATYDLSISIAPTSGSVDITVTSDAQTEVSLDGTTYTPTVTPSFTAGGVPQTITVRAFDDSDVESVHSGTITHAITTTGDPTNFPTSLAIADVTATIGDNDVVAVVAVADNSTTNVSEDGTGSEANLAPQANLLANDTDGIGNFVSSADASSAEGATVSVNADGTFTYDPSSSAAAQVLPAGSSLVDTFSYTAEDIEGNTDSATVSITVDGANDGTEALPDVLNDGPLENGTFTNMVDITANDGAFRSITTAVTFPAGSDLRTLPGITASQSSNYNATFVASVALDGNIGTFTHTAADNTVDSFWQVDLGQVASLENITLANRNDCCGVRLRDITVRVLDGGGTEIFNSGPLNVGNVLGFTGGADETLFVDLAGPIMGQTVIVDRDTDETDADAGNGSILSLSEVTIIGSVPGTYELVDDFLLLNYDAAQSAGTGRWENLGSNSGSAMDWLLTDVDLVPVAGSAHNGISAAYQWDDIADRAIINTGGRSVHDIMPGDPDLDDATWEFWVKPDNTTQPMTIFETGGTTGFGCVIYNGVLEAATESDGVTLDGSYVSYNLLDDPLGLVGGDPTTDFNQYAVTITVNGGLELYVNGVKVADSGGTGVSGDWDGGDGSGLGLFAENLHGGYNTLDAPFLGQMAIVRMYSGALSGARIYQNFNAVNTGTDIEGDAISTIGVLDGSDAFVANGSPATLASGALVIMTDAAGGFTYDPNGAFSLFPGQTTTDTFTYRVSEAGGGLTAESTVTLTITGVADPIDDNLMVKEGQTVILTPNQLIKNDEIAATPGAYVELTPPSLSGGTWTNAGSAGAAFNGTVTGTVVIAPALVSGFQTIGCASTATNLATLNAISTGDATIEIWFRPEPGQTGKSTIFDTGGNGNGFSIVFDADTNEVTANVDGGDDATANIIAIASGVSTTEFNQLIVVIDLNGGAEVGAASGVFEDLMTLYLNNDPTSPFDPAVDGSGVNALGIANDWAGTDSGGLNAIQGTTAFDENFPGTVGEVAFFRAYPSILSLAEMEANFDASIQAITAISSPTTSEGYGLTLNGDGTVTIDYSAVSLLSGETLNDSFTYSVGSSSATVNVEVAGYTVLEDWRIANGIAVDGSEDLLDVEPDGLVTLLEFAFGTDPNNILDNVPLDLDVPSYGTPTTAFTFGGGGLTFDALFVRRDDHGQSGSVAYTVQFSGDLITFYDNTAMVTTEVDPADAYQIASVPYPLVLPDGKKARFYRVKVDLVP